MSSLTSCSSSRSSSSSFRSSARYSCSSVTSVQTEASSPPPDPLFVPFLDQRATVLFGGNRGDSESFISERETFGSCQGDKKSHTEGYQGDWSHGDTHVSTGAIWVDDHYYTSADVSRFEPHDIVVMAFNSSIVIHAEKVGDDGSVMDKFTHKSLLPEDMDPLSVSGTLTPEGVLVISVKSMSRSSSHP
ncbi:heat shock protein beta-7 [Tachysurus fulvidraco]|uniref:heat shock protein beta-7 n=1 Tax=Tachysurus fulvidraco TaxID=1234273 RepID=UPI000F51435C|nr:heat shock protein beta-7 [Tachysurus fulvidraco]